MYTAAPIPRLLSTASWTAFARAGKNWRPGWRGSVWHFGYRHQQLHHLTAAVLGQPWATGLGKAAPFGCACRAARPAPGRGLFQHVRHFPEISPAARGYCRPIDGGGTSHPPPGRRGFLHAGFKYGTSFARVVARSLTIPCLECSHQQNHLAAGLWSAGGWPLSRFSALHLSGEYQRGAGGGVGRTSRIKVLGETRDINAGQFIDGVGGPGPGPFPAGPSLRSWPKGAAGSVRCPAPSGDGDELFPGP